MVTEILRTEKSWVHKNPDVCGGDPCIRDTRITVHGLVEFKKMGLADGEILKNIKGLTAADLDIALDYYARHTQEIEEILEAEAES